MDSDAPDASRLGAFLHAWRVWVVLGATVGVALSLGGGTLRLWALLGATLLVLYSRTSSRSVPSSAQLLAILALALTATWTLALWLAYHTWTRLYLVGGPLDVAEALSPLAAWLALSLAVIAAALSNHALTTRWPAHAAVAERLVVGVSFFPATLLVGHALLTWGGVHVGAYYLCALLMAQHYLLALPLPSSFAPGQLVQRRVEARLMTAFLVVVPALMHALTFAHALPLAPALHAANTALLVALPLLYLALCSLAGHAPLWWTGRPPVEQHALCARLGHVGALVGIACFEERVIFHSFTAYIAIPPPYSYIAVTVTLYALYLGATFLYPLLKQSDPRKTMGARVRRLVHVSMGVGAVASAAVLGLPLLLYFAPLLGSQALVSFYFRRSLLDWLLFVACLGVGVVWFMRASFLHLSYSFVLASFSLSSIAALLLACFLVTMMLPGLLVLASASPNGSRMRVAAAAALVAQAGVVAVVEWVLLVEPLPFYPAALVVLTSALGVLTAHRAYRQQCVPSWATWLAVSVHVAKLAVLLAAATAVSALHLVWEVLCAGALLAAWVRAVYVHRVLHVPASQPSHLEQLGFGAVTLVAAAVCDHLQHALLERFFAWPLARLHPLLSAGFWVTVAVSLLVLTLAMTGRAGQWWRRAALAALLCAALLLALTPRTLVALSRFLALRDAHAGELHVAALVSLVLWLLALVAVLSDVLSLRAGSRQQALIAALLGPSSAVLLLSYALPGRALPWSVLLCASLTGFFFALLFVALLAPRAALAPSAYATPARTSAAPSSLAGAAPLALSVGMMLLLPLTLLLASLPVHAQEWARLLVTGSLALAALFAAIALLLDSAEASALRVASRAAPPAWLGALHGNTAVFAALMFASVSVQRMGLPLYAHALLTPLLSLAHLPGAPPPSRRLALAFVVALAELVAFAFAELPAAAAPVSDALALLLAAAASLPALRALWSSRALSRALAAIAVVAALGALVLTSLSELRVLAVLAFVAALGTALIAPRTPSPATVSFAASTSSTPL